MGRNIFMISYLVEPNHTVGSQRVSYWAKHWKDHCPDDKVYVISAMDSNQFMNCDGFYKIPVSHQKSPLSKIIKDEGINWKKNLLQFFRQNDIAPDVLIMTGSPFMQFGISKTIKSWHPKCRVVLDFRDPFAVNPRFPKNRAKEIAKGYYEQKFCTWSDAVVHVNSYCSRLLTNYDKFSSKAYVIPNGYREDFQLLEQQIIPQDDLIHLVYGGKFYESDIISKLLEELGSQNVVVHHFGEQNDHSKKLVKFSNYVSYGAVDYNYLMTAIHQSNGGLIITQGEDFESTTKVYDYIANQKPIWILSPKKLNSGALLEEIENYPLYYIGDASTESIHEGVKFLNLKNDAHSIDSYKYSRKEGLKKLIKICEGF